jgi:hypothetical protein
MECNRNMQKTKTFDCVEMKRDLQKKMRERLRNVPGKNISEKIQYELEHSNSPMAELWRKRQKS